MAEGVKVFATKPGWKLDFNHWDPHGWWKENQLVQDGLEPSQTRISKFLEVSLTKQNSNNANQIQDFSSDSQFLAVPFLADW